MSFSLLSAHALTQLFRSGELSAEAIVEASLRRIDHFDPRLGSFLAVFHERAREKARKLDQKRKENGPLGRLAGVPIALKDNIHLDGEITTCGSKFLQNYRAPFNATVTTLLEQEDAIIIGKTNLDEFAMGGSGIHSAYFPTHNPWNLSCVPGGSSSGSAACVSARLCPIALGTDTGGSVRQPAAFTGIVGFKPTYGRVSRYGVVPYGSSLDQVGPFTHTVRDAALVMEILGRHCEKDATSLQLPQKPYTMEIQQPLHAGRIGVPWKLLEDLAGEIRAPFEQAMNVYKELGFEIVDVDLSFFKYSIATYYILATAEGSANLARFDGVRYGVRSKRAKNFEEICSFSRTDGFGAEVKRRILLGTFVLSSGYQEAYYEKAQAVRSLLISQIRRAFTQCEVIAMPTSPSVAYSPNESRPPLAEYLGDLYTTGANLTGVPAISIPMGFTKEGKPIGLQLYGPLTQDGRVLSYAHAFEKVTTYGGAIPPGFGELL
jgi:aspartyl-tRNA(Asn)/glutamyl-tRNA(Gln) amidotransferase subunit A